MARNIIDELLQTLAEVAGEPTVDGEWAVYWPRPNEGSVVLERYDTEMKAKAAKVVCKVELSGFVPQAEKEFTVRHWNGKEWVESDAAPIRT